MIVNHRILLMLVNFLCLTITTSFAAAQQPNIVVILADDLGLADVSYYEGEDAEGITTDPHTVAIDKLADEGIRFDNFYANSTVCSPTRASLLTGKYPGLVGMPGVVRPMPERSWGYLSPSATTLAEKLRAGGYYTGLVGKWHLGLESPNLPNDRGFDHFKGFLGDMMTDYCTHERYFEENKTTYNFMRENKRVLQPEEHVGIHATKLFTEWAIEFINEHANTDQPFFLYLAYNAPHVPIQPICPDDDDSLIGEDASRAELVAFIEDLDDHIGQVVQALEDNNVKNNTLVIFTSDNGGQIDQKFETEMHTRANNGLYRGSKTWLYEGGIRVPMVAVWPNTISARVSSGVVALTMDLYPTILEAAGISYSEDIDGVSLLSFFNQPDTQLPERDLYWECREGYKNMGAHHAVRSGEWKLVQPSLKPEYNQFELYNLLDNPFEKDPPSDNSEKYNDLMELINDHIAAESLVPYRDSKPFTGKAFTVNEKIEAEEFDIFLNAVPQDKWYNDTAEGGAYHDNEPENLLDGNCRPGEGVDINASELASNGFNVGSARAGEWLTYTVEIPVSGSYQFAARVALKGEDGRFHVEIGNKDITGPLVIPNTGGWQNWVEIKSPIFNLESGTQKMRVMLDANSKEGKVVGNFDWFKIIPIRNIALNKPAWASSIEDDDPTLAAEFAVDGDPATRWSSKYSDPQWIVVDLGARYEITRVKLDWEVAFGSVFDIQLSDDNEQWITVHSEANGDGGVDDISITGAGRYVRIYGKQRGTRWGYSLWELEVYGTLSTEAALEFGELWIDHNWTRVNLIKPFNNPVVVAGPISLNGGDPSVVRIRNVDPTGFEIRVQEWDYLDDTHTIETVGYLVIEQGNYTLDDGTMIQAATIETEASASFQNITFAKSFNVTPVVMTTLTSFNDIATVTGRIRQITTSNFQYRMQEQEDNIQDHGAESLSYIAWEPSSGEMGNIVYLVDKTADEVDHNDYKIVFDEPFASSPVFVADMQTTDGGDTSNVRYSKKNESSVDILIDEETSADAETNHTAEVVGLMIFNH